MYAFGGKADNCNSAEIREGDCMNEQKRIKAKPKPTEMPERMALAEAQKRVDEFRHINAVQGSSGGAAIRGKKKSYGTRHLEIRHRFLAVH
jgi:hypothetical protein